MWKPALPSYRSSEDGRVPTRTEARELSRRLLADQGTRLDHVRTAGHLAGQLRILFTAEEQRLLVAAATVHDIGYSPGIAQTGFHPLDGGQYLREQGYSARLAALVAHHSHAELLAPDEAIIDLLHRFPSERSLVADALVYADMHSSPSGQVIAVGRRLTDIESRHPSPRARERTTALRASVTRVQAALLHASRWERAANE